MDCNSLLIRCPLVLPCTTWSLGNPLPLPTTLHRPNPTTARMWLYMNPVNLAALKNHQIVYIGDEISTHTEEL